MTNIYANTNQIQYIKNAVLMLSLYWVNKGYAGSCIRLRRVSDSAEADFDFVNGELDWDAIIIWLGGSTGYVVYIYDQSGRGNNAHQGTASNQPQLDTTNKKILFTVSGSTFMEVANHATLNFDSISDWSIILKANLLGYNDQSSTANVPVCKNSGTYSDTSLALVLDNSNNMYFKTGASNGTSNVSVTTASPKTFIGSKSGTDAVMYENNVSIATGSSLSGLGDNASNLFIGKDGANINRQVDMDFYGLFIYRDINLTETQRGLFND